MNGHPTTSEASPQTGWSRRTVLAKSANRTIVRRRALLTGGLGALVGTTASRLTDSSTAHATHGDVHLGGQNVATAATTIVNDTVGGDALSVTATNGTALTAIANYDGLGPAGRAVHAVAERGTAINARVVETGTAVRGSVSQGTGVQGSSAGVPGTGVLGTSATQWGVGVEGRSPGTGVEGRADGEYGVGVVGRAPWRGVHGYSGNGTGVFGDTYTGLGVRAHSSTGTGVLALSGTGFAIRGDGQVRFDRVSGQAKIVTGQQAVTITPGVNVHSGSFMLLTPMDNIGSRALWFTKNPTSNTVTIHLSSPRTAATTIAWLLLG